MQDRLNILRDLQEYAGKYWSHEYIRKHVLMMTDDEIKTNDEQIQKETDDPRFSGEDNMQFNSVKIDTHNKQEINENIDKKIEELVKNKFDLVYSFGFIEHFINWEDVFSKHARLVNNGGVLIITTPNFSGFFQKYFHKIFDKNNYEKHNIESMNPTKWATYLRLLNFEIIHSGYFAPISFWVEKEKRNNISKLLIFLIRQYTRVIGKIIKANHASYSPYCGIIAKKKA